MIPVFLTVVCQWPSTVLIKGVISSRLQWLLNKSQHYPTWSNSWSDPFSRSICLEYYWWCKIVILYISLQTSWNDWRTNILKDTRGYLLFFLTFINFFFLFVPCSQFHEFLITLLYPLYVSCCLVFVYCVCRPKLVVNICINWLPIIINFSVILGSQCSPILLLYLINVFN